MSDFGGAVKPLSENPEYKIAILGVPFVMRDVTLWAFTLPFFETREGELREFEAAMAGMTQPLEAYLAQLSSIRTHDTTERLGAITTPTLVIAGEEDILIPVELSRRLHQGIASVLRGFPDAAASVHGRGVWRSPVER